jgi:hypothetical protein
LYVFNATTHKIGHLIGVGRLIGVIIFISSQGGEDEI